MTGKEGMEQCLIMAEIGVNHNGSLSLALEMIEAAAGCGVDAVKFQTYQTERLARRDTPKVSYQLRSGKKSETHFEMLKKLELPRVGYGELIECCNAHGVLFCSTPYSDDDAEFLLSLGVKIVKVASADIVDRRMHEVLSRSVAKVILSTGMATMEEIDATLEIYRAASTVDNVTLLQCTSSYPCDPADVHLLVMQTLRDTFHLSVGFSDHTVDHFAAIAARALGASVIEKHFTLDRSMAGPDHAASTIPEELALLVKGVREVEKTLGSAEKQVQQSEMEMQQVSRKSIVAAQDLLKGTTLQAENFAFTRPGSGVSPMEYPAFIGRVLVRPVLAGEQIAESDLCEAS